MSGVSETFLREVLEGLRGTAERWASYDCCCEPCDGHVCTEENPQCQTMAFRRLQAQLENLLEPKHKGRHSDRLTNAAERIFLEQWQKLNQRQRGLNENYTTLELILKPTKQKYIERVSPEQAEVAATVIQWLGTNCGLCFIQECERLIEKERPIRNDMHGVTWNIVNEPKPEEEEVAEHVSSKYLPPGSARRLLHNEIIGAIRLGAKKEREKILATLND